MNETRRGFLKLLGGLAVATATEAVFGKNIPVLPEIAAPKSLSEYDILWRSYFPMLKQNEGEILHFYRCVQKKLTVGYGSNVESNPKLLQNAVIYYKGKPLSETGKSEFLRTYSAKSKRELARYSISKADAEQMAKQFVYRAIPELVKIFTRGDRKAFFAFPVPMQVLALDVYFNVGRENFLKYKRFKKALLRSDYLTATKESIVHCGNNSVNQERERRKKRLWNITKIMQDNPSLPLKKVQELVVQNYKKETPKLLQVLAGSKEKKCEEGIVLGEFERLQLHEKVAKLKENSSYQV